MPLCSPLFSATSLHVTSHSGETSKKVHSALCRPVMIRGVAPALRRAAPNRLAAPPHVVVLGDAAGTRNGAVEQRQSAQSAADRASSTCDILITAGKER